MYLVMPPPSFDGDNNPQRTEHKAIHLESLKTNHFVNLVILVA